MLKQETILRPLLWASTLGLSWLGMMAVHEAGHVLHAFVSGGIVARVVLDPRELSRTDYVVNPHPLFVAWGGVAWGTAVPIAAAALAYARQSSHAHLFRFFAGFCCVANGAYLLVGALAGAGDPADLLAFGVPVAVLTAVGLAGGGAGLALWHKLGAPFGLGPRAKDPAPGLALSLALLLAFVVIAEMLVSSE